MIGIRARWIVVRVLRRANAQATRHVEEIRNANRRARVARLSPLRHRRRLRQIVDALADQDAHQRSRDALAHGPALERRVRRDPLAVALAHDPPFPRDHQRRRHGLRRLERDVHGPAHLCGVELRPGTVRRQPVAHGPRLGRSVRQPARDALGPEVGRPPAHRERDAPLVSQIKRRTRDTVRQRDMHGPARTIDDRFLQLGALLVGRREESQVLGGELGREAGDEHGGADDLGEARRVELQGVAWGWHVRCAELEGPGARDQGALRRRRDGGKEPRGGDEAALHSDCGLRLTPDVQRTEQHPARGGHVTYGTVERGLVGLGGRVEAADLAHELQRGVVQLVVGGRMIGVAQAFDVSAHGHGPW